MALSMTTICMECCYSQCHYADSRSFYTVVLNVAMLSVIMPNAVMLSVVAPFKFPSELHRPISVLVVSVSNVFLRYKLESLSNIY